MRCLFIVHMKPVEIVTGFDMLFFVLYSHWLVDGLSKVTAVNNFWFQRVPAVTDCT